MEASSVTPGVLGVIWGPAGGAGLTGGAIGGVAAAFVAAHTGAAHTTTLPHINHRLKRPRISHLRMSNALMYSMYSALA